MHLYNQQVIFIKIMNTYMYFKVKLNKNGKNNNHTLMPFYKQFNHNIVKNLRKSQILFSTESYIIFNRRFKPLPLCPLKRSIFCPMPRSKCRHHNKYNSNRHIFKYLGTLGIQPQSCLAYGYKFRSAA